MNLRQIQDLIKFVAKSGATEVDLEIGDVKISIKSPPKGKAMNPEVSPNQQLPNPLPPVSVEKSISTEGLKLDEEKEQNLEQGPEHYITYKAPIIGTFYRRPSPDKDAFVNVGDAISEGSVLCIIEAMKLFNEIESEISGRIVKVLVDDMSPVEYNQPLFLIDPS